MYMICHKSKSIFVHIPKTGGTSIEHSLGYVKLKKYNSGQVEIKKHSPDHRNSQDYFNLNAVQFWRYHKFTVIRDPIERELSLYRFVVKNFAKKTLDIINILNIIHLRIYQLIKNKNYSGKINLK